jgi:hypothetical protein
MPQRSLQLRIERLERQFNNSLIALGKLSPDCICFPDHEQPGLSFPILGDVAFRVKCPLHGDRFVWPRPYLYVPKWLREKEPILRQRLSAQYQKAWESSFPADLWPADEEQDELGLYLRLKDGTRLLAYEFRWKKQR